MLKEAKIESDQDKVDDKQEKQTAETTYKGTNKQQNVANPPKRKYIFKNKYKQLKKIQNDKLKKSKQIKKAERNNSSRKLTLRSSRSISSPCSPIKENA